MSEYVAIDGDPDDFTGYALQEGHDYATGGKTWKVVCLGCGEMVAAVPHLEGADPDDALYRWQSKHGDYYAEYCDNHGDMPEHTFADVAYILAGWFGIDTNVAEVWAEAWAPNKREPDTELWSEVDLQDCDHDWRVNPLAQRVLHLLSAEPVVLS